MAQGILNAKLDELDRQLRKVHRKIQKSGSANPARLRADLEQIRKEAEKLLTDILRSGVLTEKEGHEKMEAMGLEPMTSRV